MGSIALGICNAYTMCRAQKGGFARDAAAEGIAIVYPDTSPRGAGSEGEDKDWDFGTGESRLVVTYFPMG